MDSLTEDLLALAQVARRAIGACKIHRKYCPLAPYSGVEAEALRGLLTMALRIEAMVEQRRQAGRACPKQGTGGILRNAVGGMTE